jgi:hypothetical protein
MAAVAKNPAFAKKVGIKQSVGEEFLQADKGRKFSSGGKPTLQGVNKPKTHHGSQTLFKEGGEMKESKAMAKKEIAFMQKKGAPKSMIKHEKAEYGMKKGGMASCATAAKKEVKSHEKRMHGMKAGGSCYSKGGGIEIKGKTRGKVC